MTVRTKLNQKYLGNRTQLIRQTENLPAVIKPDFTEVRSKDILLRDMSRDNLPAVYKKPKAIPTPVKRTSLVTKGLKLGASAVGLALRHPIITTGAALAGGAYALTAEGRRYNLAPKTGEGRDLRSPVIYRGLEDFE